MNSKARITFRFDKENGARVERKSEENERPIKSNVVPFFQEELKFSSDAGTWNSPFQDDSSALEQLIRETDSRSSAPDPSHTSRTASEERNHRPQPGPQPTAKQRSANEASFNPPQHYHHEWVDHVPLGDELAVNSPIDEPEVYPIIELDDYEDRNKSKLHSGAASLGSFKTAKNYRPSRGPSWYKVFASVTGAIVTGALFGYFVLALFTGEPADETSDLPAVGSPASTAATISRQQANDGQVKGGNQGASSTGGSNAASTSAIKVDVPKTSYFMLQFGVFSNKEGSDAAVAELSGKGLAAAALSAKDRYPVYVGVAADRDKAIALSQSLSGMDVYIKQIDVPALSAIPFKGDSAVVESFFKQTDDLIRAMDDMTLSKLGQTAGKEEGNWSELHQQWTKSVSVMENGIADKDEKAALLKLVQQINTAAVAAQEYAKNQSEAHLWTIQTALIKAVFAEQAWFASMGGL